MSVVFWVAAGLLIYTQVGYGLLLALLPRPRRVAAAWSGPLPPVSVIVAAHNEQDVIGDRVANLRALDYPDTEIIVVSDGSTDATVARAAGADRVLDLPRGGKVPAQDAAVAVAGGELLAFTDANAAWRPDALRRLVDAFGDPKVGYACGRVSFSAPEGSDNQEGLYWRYEMFLRARESALYSITAGNGAIYAVRAEAYQVVPPMMSHDISFPFKLVKRGWRAVYVPEALATEKMAPSIETEFARKRRMARRSWPTVLAGGMLSPRGYPPLYALMIFSHRLLRYASPFLHLVALAANIAAVALGAGPLYIATLACQVALLVAALLGLAIARYYVWTTASLGVGLIDWLAGANTVTWESVEGTR
ncbi:MAG: glycosyltransferase [Solirubrobacterales bacterium]|nr:glycosyltransferase [Solirubrobacterales bacterium]